MAQARDALNEKVNKSKHLNAIHVTIGRKKTEPVTITWTNKDDNTQSCKGADCNCKQKKPCGLTTSAPSVTNMQFNCASHLLN
jgi:hypothetical protein